MKDYPRVASAIHISRCFNEAKSAEISQGREKINPELIIYPRSCGLQGIFIFKGLLGKRHS